jgi:hypothetical protein
MFGRVKEAMSDAAETLRRAFSSLAVVEASPEPFVPHSHGSSELGAVVRAGLEAPRADLRDMPLFREAVESRALEPFEATLRAESGWARWGTEATVLRMAPLEPGRATQVGVPPLPRRVPVAGQADPLARPAARRLSDPLLRPGVRRLDPALEGGMARAGLAAAFALPVPIRGEDIHHLPKGLWMRYSLQLVRGTGENVRNLEVLGLFRIPRKGVADLRHDPRSGRIFVHLEPVAASAPRAPFILARRKDDGALVSCFVEES